MRIRCAWTQRATHGTSTGEEPASRAHGGGSTVSLDGRCRSPSKPGVARYRPCAGSHGQRGLEPRSAPWPARPSARSTGQPRRRGGVPAAGRRLHCIGPPHTPAPLLPIGWTIKDGRNRMYIDGQGGGWTKWSGWPHRRARWLTGFSTTWAGSRRRIGSGRAVGVRGGSWPGRRCWPTRRPGAAMSGCGGICRF